MFIAASGLARLLLLRVDLRDARPFASRPSRAYVAFVWVRPARFARAVFFATRLVAAPVRSPSA